LRPRITPGVPLSVISKELVAYGPSLMFIVCFVNNYDGCEMIANLQLKWWRALRVPKPA
jgi:hypothetical protein